MTLGAPADLVEEATRAMQDEAAHTRACFGLASAFAEAPVGPGRLATSDSLEQRSLRDVIVTTVLEGCVGETVAALEAAEAAAHASEPAVRQVLSRIAEDELRHAGLAYRFVAWTLRQHGDSLRPHVEAAYESAAACVTEEPAPESPVRTTLESHGLLSTAQRRELRRVVLRDLVGPTLLQLLAAGDSRRCGRDLLVDHPIQMTM
jgi:hypothetical protein